MICQHQGCSEIAVFYPILKVTPDKLHYANAELRQLGTCEAHTKVIELNNIINDEGWNRIVSGFLAIGRAEPVRAYTLLEWGKL